MRQTIFTIILLSVFSVQFSMAQSYEKETFARKKNVVSFDLMGSGGYASANYSYVAASFKNLFLDFKLGVGTHGFPHGFSLNAGGGSHYFQAGVMGRWDYYKEPAPRYTIAPVLGYKLHPIDKHFFFNVYITSFRDNYFGSSGVGGNPIFKPWFGIGTGYAFSKQKRQ